MDTDPKILAAREKLKARIGDTQTGGKGSVRRTRKAIHKSNAADDKKVYAAFKTLGLQSLSTNEQVNIFLEDGNVIHFKLPKVDAALSCNTFIVSGRGETKPLKDILPGIIDQIGMESISELQNIMKATTDAVSGLEGVPEVATFEQ